MDIDQTNDIAELVLALDRLSIVDSLTAEDVQIDSNLISADLPTEEELNQRNSSD